MKATFHAGTDNSFVNFLHRKKKKKNKKYKKKLKEKKKKKRKTGFKKQIRQYML